MDLAEVSCARTRGRAEESQGEGAGERGLQHAPHLSAVHLDDPPDVRWGPTDVGWRPPRGFFDRVGGREIP